MERDQLEKLTSRADTDTVERGARLFAEGVEAHTRQDMAIMNGALLFSAPPAADPVPWPGDVFRYSDVFPAGTQPPVTFSGTEVLKDIFEPNQLALRQKGKEPVAWHYLSEVERACGLVLVEVTPVCDYVQDKHVFSSFVCGVLVPVDHQSKVRGSNAQFLWKTPPFSLRATDSSEVTDSVLVLDFQFTFSTEKQCAGGVRPLFRLREAVLHAIQAGRGRHVSRPGYASVDPPHEEKPNT